MEISNNNSGISDVREENLVSEENGIDEERKLLESVVKNHETYSNTKEIRKYFTRTNM